MNRIEFVGNALFIPFFLISVGMLVNVRVLVGSVDALIVAGTMLGCVISGKLLAAKIAQKVLKQSSYEGTIVFGLTIAQAAANLAVVLIAHDEGIFDDAVLNGTILMIAATCFIAPLVTERAGRKMALKEQVDTTGIDPSEAPQRFLVPMAYAATSQNLLDMTFVIREHHSEEPVFPLSVVQEDEDTASRVADAEKMLSAAVVHGAAAEVPIVPVTRVSHNPASGIARAVVERRISDIVLGWQGPDKGARGTYGKVIDQILEETQQQVLICHLTQPIATIKRVIAVFPPDIEYHRGYVRGIRDIKRLTNAVGAVLTGLCINDDMRKIRSKVDTTKPELASSFVGFNTMEDLVSTLEKRVEDNDLVVFLTARRGTPPWTPQLQSLPTRMSSLAEHSMTFLFLSDLEVASAEGLVTPASLADFFILRQFLSELESDDETPAVGQLLRTHLAEDRENLQDLIDGLLREDTSFTRELTNGVLLLNARISAVQRTRIFAGFSTDGIQSTSHPNASIHGIFILLSPLETSLQDHLELFSELGEMVTRINDIEALADIERPMDLLEEIRSLAREKDKTFPDDRKVPDVKRLEDVEV